MSDLNDLNRPLTTDTEPTVLNTLRAHIVRAATWTGWGSTANKVAGLMSAVTAAVSGGRSLRLYRRNDANTADEEVVSLPGISVGGNAATASAAQGGSSLRGELDAKAALNSPALTGTPTAPTAAAGTANTQIASTAFVATAVANVVDSSPAALDTLNELAAALGNDPNFATSTATALGNRVVRASANRSGVTRLYRRDEDNAYNLQTHWTGGRWRLDGYNNDAFHAGVEVAYADTAGSAATAGHATTAGSATTAENTRLGGGNVSTNLANGTGALQNNTDGYGNTASGTGALQNNTSGYGNTASGFNALSKNTTGTDGTANGFNALVNNTTGAGNTGDGFYALSNNTTFSNVSGFGRNAQVTGSNQVQLGDSSTTTYVYGTVQNRSDLRDKADVRDTVLGLDFICSIRPVDYRLDMRDDYRPERVPDLADDATEEQRAEHKAAIDAWLEACKHKNLVHDGSKKRSRYHHGVIAQEVKDVLDAQGIDFGGYQDHKVAGGDDVLSIGYDEFIAPLIKAVQELSAQVQQLKAQIDPPTAP